MLGIKARALCVDVSCMWAVLERHVRTLYLPHASLSSVRIVKQKDQIKTPRVKYHENPCKTDTGLHLEIWQWGLTEKPRTVALGSDSTACTGFLGAWSVWMHTYLDLDRGGRALDFPQGSAPWLLLELETNGIRKVGGEVGNGRRGGGENFY